MGKVLIENYDWLIANFRRNLSDRIAQDNSAMKIFDDRLRLDVAMLFSNESRIELDRVVPGRFGRPQFWPVVKMKIRTEKEKNATRLLGLEGWVDFENHPYSVNYRVSRRNPRLAVVEKVRLRDWRDRMAPYIYPRLPRSFPVSTISEQQELLDFAGFPRSFDWTKYAVSLLCLSFFPEGFVPTDGQQVCGQAVGRIKAQDLHANPVF